MPNRIARDSARTSRTLAQLSDFGERGFWRLMLTADDFGRFEADPAIVLAQCFPRMMDRITLSMCEQMLRECVAVGLIELYEVDGTNYGHFVKANKYFTRRAKHSKYPPATQTHRTCIASAPEDRGSRGEESRIEVGNGKPPEDLALASTKEAKQFLSELTRNLSAKMRP